MYAGLKYSQSPIPSVIELGSSRKQFITALGEKTNKQKKTRKFGKPKFNKPISVTQPYRTQLSCGDCEVFFTHSFTFGYNGFQENSFFNAWGLFTKKQITI